jgi:hypothetical protein
MKNKYVYNGEDITTDVVMKIEHVATLIASKESCDFESAYLNFIESKAYAALQKTASLMWAESAEFIVDEYFRERGEESERLLSERQP